MHTWCLIFFFCARAQRNAFDNLFSSKPLIEWLGSARVECIKQIKEKVNNGQAWVVIVLIIPKQTRQLKARKCAGFSHKLDQLLSILQVASGLQSMAASVNTTCEDVTSLLLRKSIACLPSLRAVGDKLPADWWHRKKRFLSLLKFDVDWHQTTFIEQFSIGFQRLSFRTRERTRTVEGRRGLKHSQVGALAAPKAQIYAAVPPQIH